jgi:exosortase
MCLQLRAKFWRLKCKSAPNLKLTTAFPTQIVPAPSLFSGWMRFGLVTGLIAVLYADVVAGLVHDWLTEPSLSYGLLVPPLAACMAYWRKDEVLRRPAVPDNRGLVVIAAACLTYLSGRFAAEFFLQRVSLPLLAAGLIWTYWGAARLRSLGFVLLLLGTMMPLPDLVYASASFPLQLLVSAASANIAQWCGTVVLREGNVLHLARLNLGVEEACSGLNSLASLMVTAVVLAVFACRGRAAQAGVLLLWCPVAIFVNILRVSVTAILADFDREFAVGVYHFFSSWLVFLIAFGLMYAGVTVLNRFSREQS